MNIFLWLLLDLYSKSHVELNVVVPFTLPLTLNIVSPLTSDHLELIYNLMTCLALSGYRSFVPTLIHASGPFGLQDTYSSVCCLIITWQLEMERGKKKGIGTFIKDHLWAVILLGSLCGLPHSILIIPLWNLNYYHCFRDKETEEIRVSSLSKVTEPVRGREITKILAWSWSTQLFHYSILPSVPCLAFSPTLLSSPPGLGPMRPWWRIPSFLYVTFLHWF